MNTIYRKTDKSRCRDKYKARPLKSIGHFPQSLFQGESTYEVFVIEIRANYHDKKFALSLPLKERIPSSKTEYSAFS